MDDCSLFWAHGTAPAPAPAPRVLHIARMRTSSLHRGAGTASATGTRCATGGAPQHYHRRAQAPTGVVGHERGARPSDVTPTPSRSQVASICHGRAHQSCVYSLARCVLCARVCERALSQVRQQVRGSTRDHRHSLSVHSRRPLVVPPHRARRTKNVAKCCALGSPSSWRRPFCFALAGHPRWRRRFRAPSSTRMSSRPS